MFATFKNKCYIVSVRTQFLSISQPENRDTFYIILYYDINNGFFIPYYHLSFTLLLDYIATFFDFISPVLRLNKVHNTWRAWESHCHYWCHGQMPYCQLARLNTTIAITYALLQIIENVPLLWLAKRKELGPSGYHATTRFTIYSDESTSVGKTLSLVPGVC